MIANFRIDHLNETFFSKADNFIIASSINTYSYSQDTTQSGYNLYSEITGNKRAGPYKSRVLAYVLNELRPKSDISCNKRHSAYCIK